MYEHNFSIYVYVFYGNPYILGYGKPKCMKSSLLTHKKKLIESHE